VEIFIKTIGKFKCNPAFISNFRNRKIYIKMEELAVGTRVDHPRYGEGIISKDKITSYEIWVINIIQYIICRQRTLFRWC